MTQRFILTFLSIMLMTTPSWAVSRQRLEAMEKEMNCMVYATSNVHQDVWQEECAELNVKKQGRMHAITSALDDEERYDDEYYEYEEYEELGDDSYSQDTLQDYATEYQQYIIDEDEEEDIPIFTESDYDEETVLFVQRLKKRKERFARGEFGVATGYRQDDIGWNIGGNADGALANILAEYQWPNQGIWQTTVDGDIVFKNRYVVDGSVSYGSTVLGDNQVSEYDSDNRSNESVRTNNSSAEGNTLDGSVGMGLLFDLSKHKDFLKALKFISLDLKMLAGYSYHEQDLTMYDGVQTVDSSGGALGSFGGLDSYYDMEWTGPWIGVELSGSDDKLSSFVSLKYHEFDYYGVGGLNLQPSLEYPKSFDHEGEGQGLSFDVGLGYQLTPAWMLNVKWNVKDWEIQNGRDRLYAVGGGTVDANLNEVGLFSQSLMLGSTFNF